MKRVEKLAQSYTLDGDTLKLKDKIVPRPEEREAIAEKAHLFGHFQLEATVRRVREEYIWKNMNKTAQRVIAKCDVCMRHHKERVIDHPARSVEITGVRDRVNIDLVRGLPVVDGYDTLWLAVDSLTKYPVVEPIQSKSASSVVEQLGRLVTTFGAPKVILSDQGPEFCNRIVEEWARSEHVEWKVTSAYHPRTNGLVERFNGTFMECLRKFAERNPLAWPKWIPFILMAYRTKVNVSTGFSPFKLAFGDDDT